MNNGGNWSPPDDTAGGLCSVCASIIPVTGRCCDCEDPGYRAAMVAHRKDVSPYLIKAILKTADAARRAVEVPPPMEGAPSNKYRSSWDAY